jgi:hypothetical protein
MESRNYCANSLIVAVAVRAVGRCLERRELAVAAKARRTTLGSAGAMVERAMVGALVRSGAANCYFTKERRELREATRGELSNASIRGRRQRLHSRPRVNGGLLLSEGNLRARAVARRQERTNAIIRRSRCAQTCRKWPSSADQIKGRSAGATLLQSLSRQPQ